MTVRQFFTIIAVFTTANINTKVHAQIGEVGGGNRTERVSVAIGATTVSIPKQRLGGLQQGLPSNPAGTITKSAKDLEKEKSQGSKTKAPAETQTSKPDQNVRPPVQDQADEQINRFRQGGEGLKGKPKSLPRPTPRSQEERLEQIEGVQISRAPVIIQQLVVIIKEQVPVYVPVPVAGPTWAEQQAAGDLEWQRAQAGGSCGYRPSCWPPPCGGPPIGLSFHIGGGSSRVHFRSGGGRVCRR